MDHSPALQGILICEGTSAILSACKACSANRAYPFTFALDEKVNTPFGGFGMDRTPLQGVLIGGFRVETAPLQGILNCLLASQQVVDVVAEHQLDNIREYPLIVYPEWDTLSASLKENLLHYVSEGGKLLVVGPKAAKQFQDVLQVEFIGQPKMSDNGLEFGGWIGNSLSLSQEILVKGSARPFGKFFRHWDMEGTFLHCGHNNPVWQGTDRRRVSEHRECLSVPFHSGCA